jgi:hypothetical protein
MSEAGPGNNAALNWRGPLLAAGIFAAVFAILLIMAHQNESKTSDMGSSLREDPYGASLLFDIYGRAGYQVKRGQNEKSLSDQDASKTTAFFIGGYSPNDFTKKNGEFEGGAKFRGRLEEFLARGGRVVLVAPSGEVKSQAQGWEVSDKWEGSARDHTPQSVLPDVRVMPVDSEMMYLSYDSSWLQTDPGWTALYSKPAGSDGKADTPARVYMAMRKVGNGELIAASEESFLLNETIKTHPNPVLLDFLSGGRPVIWVDETLHGLHQDEGVLWLVQRYRLQAAVLLFWTALLILLWSMSGDLVRRAAHEPSAQVVRHGEAAGVAARCLLQRSIAKESVVSECWEQFKRSSPQDAQAIAADPVWGKRLRTALAQPPIVGYRELSSLIAERREIAKGLARVDRAELENSSFNR